MHRRRDDVTGRVGSNAKYNRLRVCLPMIGSVSCGKATSEYRDMILSDYP